VPARPHADRRRYRHLHLLAIVALLAGCGGGGGAGSLTVGAAKTYSLRQQVAGNAVTLKIVQPDGTPLTRFKRSSGPHSGVHVILVRRDLGVILHRHPTVHGDGTFTVDAGSLPPGPYRIVVDAYPAAGPQPNFQLFGTLRRPGAYTARALPGRTSTQVVDGYRVTLHGNPKLRAVTPAFLTFTVTSPDGKPAQFTPWYGALAHAIFFRTQTLDYFHTHVCSAGATGCTSSLGGARVTGKSTTPGRLNVGVLVPVPGTWRLFLQLRADGRTLTAPFTLQVR
jgi:hypothetical protein